MRHPRHYRRGQLGASTLLATTLAVIAAGCSVSIGGTTLDTDQLEDEIRSQVDRAGNVDVSCPSGIDIEAGGTFSCTLTTPEGEQLNVEVRQTDDEGNVRWEVTGPASEGDSTE